MISLEDRSVGIMNLTYDAVSFIKGSDSMKESEVYCAPYCAPYTMNRDSKAQGEDGYVTCKFTNEGEKSKVEFKLAEASRDSTKENYLESITASAVYGNSEYEEIPCRDDQQEEDLLTVSRSCYYKQLNSLIGRSVDRIVVLQ